LWACQQGGEVGGSVVRAHFATVHLVRSEGAKLAPSDASVIMYVGGWNDLGRALVVAAEGLLLSLSPIAKLVESSAPRALRIRIVLEDGLELLFEDGTPLGDLLGGVVFFIVLLLELLKRKVFVEPRGEGLGRDHGDEAAEDGETHADLIL
jgi:hypothetical protein